MPLVLILRMLAMVRSPAVASMGKLFAFFQEYTGFVSPGVLVTFLLGMFWKRATSTAALWTVLLTIPFSILLKISFPNLAFLDRMMITFLMLLALAIVISLKDQFTYNANYNDDTTGVRSSTIFNIGSMIIVGLIAAFYIIFGKQA